MKSVKVAGVLLFVILAVGASGLELKGRVTRLWEHNSFTIETRSEETVLWFDLPKNSRIVVLVEASGVEPRRVPVNSSAPLTLKGMKEWRITVKWDSVDCEWGLRLAKGEEPVLNRVQGYASTGFTFRFQLVTEEELEVWQFTSPKDATFIVRQSAVGARGSEEQDLADDPKVKLIGAGIFNIEVDPIDGEGEFVAERVR
ncbi:MAG: hypothetical protein ABIK22_05645 [candidate division WOR-3 bacterium]